MMSIKVHVQMCAVCVCMCWCVCNKQTSKYKQTSQGKNWEFWDPSEVGQFNITFIWKIKNKLIKIEQKYENISGIF